MNVNPGQTQDLRMIGVAGRYVTEDFSRKVRKHREELIKFAKSLRNVEPDARSSNYFVQNWPFNAYRKQLR